MTHAIHSKPAAGRLSGRLQQSAAALMIALALVGCAQGAGEKEVAGTLIGATVGGLLGSRFGHGEERALGAGIGVVMGGLIGSSIGRSLDEADRRYQAQAYQYSLERSRSGQATTWVNPDSGNGGSFTPTRTYQREDGIYCREFQQTVTIGGNEEQAYGTACRQPDGSWRIEE